MWGLTQSLLNAVLNQILASYVENWDKNQVSASITQGSIVLPRLRLKRGALDKFRLPLDVIEGYLGTLTITIPWLYIQTQPIEILVEDVYLLAVPSSHGDDSPEEIEKRIQDTKAERLENAELLHERAQAPVQDTTKQQGFLNSLTRRILNNLQVKIKNIHVRYEDGTSVANHPFAVGFTLANLSAISVNDKWQPEFIQDTAGEIRKLAKLDSLAVYFDTDAQSLSGLDYDDFVKAFRKMISRNSDRDHQFILKPVSGEGRIVMESKPTKDKPRFDVQLLFETIGVILDDDQYRDTISLIDMFHIYTRQQQYRRYRPPSIEFKENKARALLKFAGAAVLDEVHERHRRWTWDYFAERRSDRHRYVELYKRKQRKLHTPEDGQKLAALEKKLKYEDIRFYRSIARSQLRKDAEHRQQVEDEKRKSQPQQQSGWLPSLWPFSSSSAPEQAGGSIPSGEMSEEEKKELYALVDYDERAEVAESFEVPGDAVKMRVAAQLKKGAFALKSDPHGEDREIISVDFDVFQATVLQRPDNFEASASLGGFGVFDNTAKDTLYRQIVQVKTDGTSVSTSDQAEPFFFVKFENNPLDNRADMALAVKMRHMEIIYHKGYVEAIYRFFKPPESQLESVDALLSAASETFEGVRNQTRAGLEYALQTHKTIDLQVDMNAPIIIVPESITKPHCTHLLVDAGHISVESNLADKNAVKEIYSKRNQTYTDEDYAKLEALMYDKLSVKLHSAQFVLGDDLESCRKALTSTNGHGNLHLLERINIDLLAQHSIVPTVTKLTRFKMSGSLPSLKVNFSDAKYKAILRLIDVTIPHFGDDENTSATPSRPPPASSFRMPSGFLNIPGQEYNLDDDDGDEGDGQHLIEQSSSADPGIHQKTFELDFRVDTLSASIAKVLGDTEKPLGSVSFNKFYLGFGLAKYDMKVDVKLGSLSMDLTEDRSKPLQVLSSLNSDSPHGRDLLTVDYTRVQKNSPEFTSIYEGIDQSVDLMISTVVARVSPEAVLTLYDFIMTTFVPSSGENAPSRQIESTETPDPAVQQATSDQKIRVSMVLDGVKAILENVSTKLVTLSLSTATASIALVPNAMDINLRLGSLAVTDDSTQETSSPDFKLLLSHEGSENLAEVQYRTFDPSDKATYGGFKSAFNLKAASLKVHYLEQPLHDLYVFLMKLAKLKGLYDAATQVAVQRAAEIERMQFDIAISSPVIVFPANPVTSLDALTMRLGAISAKNSYDENNSKVTASLAGVQLTATSVFEDGPSTLKLIEDIHVTAEVLQPLWQRDDDPRPDTLISISVSDVKLALTEMQYVMIMDLLLHSIPRVLAGAPEGQAQADSSVGTPRRVPSEQEQQVTVSLQPELVSTGSVSTSMELAVTVGTIKLHLYDNNATTMSKLKQHGLARFALSGNSLRMKMLTDGSMELQLIFKSFTMNDIRPGPSMFHEIIPAAQHQRNQFMVLFTSSGGPVPQSMAVITVDSPQLILAVELVFSLLSFALKPFQGNPPAEQAQINDEAEANTGAPAKESGMAVRVDVHDIDVVVLENIQDANSQAIRLSVGQISLSQQETLALSVYNLGMYLTRMGQRNEVVRLLDDIDLTLSLASNTGVSQQKTEFIANCKPVILRASYRDIILLLGITNKVLEAYSKQSQSGSSVDKSSTTSLVERSRPPHRSGVSTGFISARSTQITSKPLGKARVLMSKETFTATVDGLKLILIGDIQEQPLLQVQFKAFRIEAKDWTGHLDASTTIAMSINYWNLSNSHWEPFIDPWVFTASVERPEISSAIVASLISKERLNLNISTTSIELALDIVKAMSGKEGERVLQTARGTYAPYRIRNRTGTDLFIWSDTDGTNKIEATASELVHGKTIDWRFDDWRAMREHTSSRENNIAIQFIGQPWEQLKGVPVDREGEYTFLLRPRAEAIYSRLLCEVKIEGGVKIVTLRSTYKISNLTLYPVEIGLSDDDGRTKHDVVKLSPGQDYSLPIEAIGRCKIRVQPDQGFGYKWSTGIRWDDLIHRQSFTLKCPHADQAEAGFRFHAFVQTDGITEPVKKYPKIDLKLRAPIELENLLPYDVQYRVYDKNSNQNWRSFLRKGGVMPVHSVELEHLVLLNIEIQETAFKPSDFAIINTDNQSDFETEKILTLADNHGRKLNLMLNYIRYPDAGGAFKVQIYSPYLVINKTGQPFGVRSIRLAGGPLDVAGDLRPEVLKNTTPFLLSHATNAGREFVFQLGNSSWSKAISFDAPSAETEITMNSGTDKSQDYHVGLSWAAGLGKYKLSKVITLAPRFILKSNLTMDVEVREHGVTCYETLSPGGRLPLLTMRAEKAKLLSIKHAGSLAEWSPNFSIEDLGSVFLRVKEPGEHGSTQLIRADVKIDGAVIFVTFNAADDEWPFRIENDSDHPVEFWQVDNTYTESRPAHYTTYALPERAQTNYAWDFPAPLQKRLRLQIYGSCYDADILEIGTLVPFDFRTKANKRSAVSLDVRADGPTQVLLISNYNRETSVYRPRGHTGTMSARRADSLTSSVEGFEPIVDDAPPTMTFKVDFEGVGVSLINRKLVEVVYLTLLGLKFDYSTSPIAQSVVFGCNSLQIDNQLHDALFPVVLQPTPLSRTAKEVAAPPAVQASIIWLADQAHGVLFIKYCSVLLQALTVEADEDFLLSVFELSQIKGVSWEEAQEDILIEHPTDIPEPQPISTDSAVYFEVLELQPIRLSFSFMRTERSDADTKLSLRNPLAVIFNAFTMTVGNIQDATLEMNALAIKDVRLSPADLQSRIVYHYRQEVLRQLYRIIGSADFIGNPVGLFTNVSSGVLDIFYEPFQGVVMHGNRDLGVSIAKGAASFVKKTVFGFSDSMTKFTSSIGKGLSAATLDSEYQKRRRMNQRRNKPRHALYGVTAGAEAFANSVASGVEGVVMKPLEGAESEGAFGFFKGVGKGFVGAVTKPVVGVFDLAASVTEGVRNTTTVFDSPARDRVRLPRLIPSDKVLAPYSARDSLGQFWMKDLEHGAYRSESYVAHINIPGGDSVVLLTTTRVLAFWTKRVRLEWDLPFALVKGISLDDRGIRFEHRNGRQQDKFALVPDKASQNWFFQQIAAVVRQFNARRRLDSAS